MQDWMYEIDFTVVSNDDNLLIQEALNHLRERFDNKTEHGIIHFKQDRIGLRVVFAKGDIEGGAQIKWEGDPAIFDESSIRWTFIGEIVWKKDVRDKVKSLSSKFNGLEYHTVGKRDQYGKPILLTGKLLGCVQDICQFTLKGDISYKRITNDEFELKLDMLNNHQSIVQKSV